MRKRLGVTLVLLAMVMLASCASAATAITYGEVGPLKLCYLCGGTDGAGTSVEVDSTARNFNTAMAGAVANAADTSITYAMPEDIVWGVPADADTLPLMIRMARVDDQSGTANAGGAADTLQVSLQMNYGGTAFPYSLVSGTDGMSLSQIALVGTGTGGIAIFKPSIAATIGYGPIYTYTICPRSYGATQFRVRCRSISAAAHAGRYQLYLRYPKLAQ